jgi:hypothetical protein
MITQSRKLCFISALKQYFCSIMIYWIPVDLQSVYVEMKFVLDTVDAAYYYCFRMRPNGNSNSWNKIAAVQLLSVTFISLFLKAPIINSYKLPLQFTLTHQISSHNMCTFFKKKNYVLNLWCIKYVKTAFHGTILQVKRRLWKT